MERSPGGLRTLPGQVHICKTCWCLGPAPLPRPGKATIPGSLQAHPPARATAPACTWAGLAGTGVLGSDDTTSLDFLLSGPSRIRSGVLYFPLTCSNS